MREILFRGKRCDNGEWVQGYYIKADHHWHKHGIHKDWITLGASANGGWFALHNKYAVKAETVCQFTGLTDKDGKKIFEGDIVNCYTLTGMNDYRRGVVHWNEMFCGWYGKESCSLLCGLGEIYEVIGNIHDNPELL